MHRYGVSESGIVCKGNEKIDYLYLFHGLFLSSDKFHVTGTSVVADRAGVAEVMGGMAIHALTHQHLPFQHPRIG